MLGVETAVETCTMKEVSLIPLPKHEEPPVRIRENAAAQPPNLDVWHQRHPYIPTQEEYNAHALIRDRASSILDPRARSPTMMAEA